MLSLTWKHAYGAAWLTYDAPESPEAKACKALTHKRTLSTRDVEALEALGVSVSVNGRGPQ